MSTRFVVMLAIGLGLMGLFWWKTWESEDKKAADAAAITGCAETPNCPAHLPLCHTGHALPDGVCSSKCQLSNQCPYNWCCAPPETPGGDSMCVPRLTCGRLGLN